MANLLLLTRAHGPNGETDSGSEITLNAFHIMMIEHSHQREPGASKVLMSNGKIFFVEETQDEIRELANAHPVL
jgi:uncharacterized protein YlzI (FlbEa/FlbD family)